MISNMFYALGYRQAVSDIRQWFVKHSKGLKFNRLYNAKGLEAILACMDKESGYMQEAGSEAEFSYRRDGNNLKIERVVEK